MITIYLATNSWIVGKQQNMAKLSFVSCIILFLFYIALSGNVFVKMVSGDKCYEDVGVCDADCFARCKAAHPKGQGSCVGAPICRCWFDQCKSCSEALGSLGTCALDQCKSACATKHPNRKAVGYCFNVGEAGGDCFCEYDCW